VQYEILGDSQFPEDVLGRTNPASLFSNLMEKSLDLSTLYSNRFDPAEQRRKDRLWQVLCRDFFQKYVAPSDTVLDLGAGYCEFINHIHCAVKIAVDMNIETSRYAKPNIKVLKCMSNAMPSVLDSSVDVVFTSNFFEHLPDKFTFGETLREIFRVLRPRGKLLVLQPNIRLLNGEYWDFLDHYIPLTDRTVVEALTLAGFRVIEVRPRFLPYTTKSRIPQHPWLVWLYLRFPLLHRVMGKQAWIVGVK
jgi:ubiquinone/menaquinone biosynthesis C-methylase UbiE